METERRYWLAFVFLPLLLFLIYASTDLQGWLFSPRRFSPAISLDQHEMLRGELSSIALLRQQEEDLLRLLTSTTSNSTERHSQDLQASIMAQLRVNREVQQNLLFPHLHNYPLHAPASESCRPVSEKNGTRSAKKRIPWRPKKSKYLLAICTSGQFSNHLICIEKHMFFAALLQRTLVLPHPKVDFNYERVLNISHIQHCLGGKNTVITFEEFSRRRKRNLHVNRLLCYMRDCYLDKEHEEALKRLGLSWGKKENAWPHKSFSGSSDLPHLDATTFVNKFACEEEVIGIGDVFYANVEDEWVKQTGGPLYHSCESIIRPHNFILSTAERFVQTFLGKDFFALHFRRYGFLTFCNMNSKRGQNCYFYPIPQAAQCILRKVDSSIAPVIYLSTDAQESETSVLQGLLVRNGVTVPLVQRPKHDKGEKWDTPLSRHGVLDDKEVIGMLDKTICAMASTFIGSAGSTFTDDILRMRREWGTANTCDEYLCQGEEPNFIADMH